MEQITLTPAQEASARMYKSYFPYRIVFGVVLENGEIEFQARLTMHVPNRLIREGKTVFLVNF